MNVFVKQYIKTRFKITYKNRDKYVIIFHSDSKKYRRWKDLKTLTRSRKLLRNQKQNHILIKSINIQSLWKIWYRQDNIRFNFENSNSWSSVIIMY